MDNHARRLYTNAEIRTQLNDQLTSACHAAASLVDSLEHVSPNHQQPDHSLLSATYSLGRIQRTLERATWALDRIQCELERAEPD